MSNFHLESLSQTEIGLTDAFCACLIESAVVCFLSQNHDSDVTIHVQTNEDILTFSVQWDLVITDAIHKTYRDEKRTTDWGAMCVAILLVRQFTRYTNFETTKTGDGIDFWLMEENGFDFAARLEVSGIRQQTKTNSITSRLERKKKQTQQSDATQLPAYIAITEFSKPEALFFLK